MSGDIMDKTVPVNDEDEPILGLDSGSDLEPSDGPQPGERVRYSEAEDTDPAPSADPAPVSDLEPSAEDQARAKGWKPLAEWSGDPSTHVSAEEFLKRGIESKSVVVKERDALTDEVRKMREQAEQDRQDARRREAQIAINAQRQAKAHYERIAEQARKEKDFDTYDEANRRAAAADAESQRITDQHQQNVNAAPDPAFEAFIERNPWYNSNPVLAEEADKAGRRLAQQEGLQGQALLDRVEQSMREVYPHVFQNPRRQTAAKVESGGGSAKVATKTSVASLGGEYVSAFNDFWDDFKGDFKNKAEAEAHYVAMITGGQNG